MAEYVRIAIIDAWFCLLNAEIVDRNEVIEYLRYLLQKEWEKPFIFSWLVWFGLDLEATELLPEIEQIYKDHEIDVGLVGSWDSSRGQLLNEPGYIPAPGWEGYDFITDTIAELETWASFQEEEPKTTPDHSDVFEESPIAQDQIAWDSEYRGTFVRENVKTGKNEPCFCGSGRKYKKCRMNL